MVVRTSGTAIFAWSLALQRHLIFRNTLEHSCLSLAVVVFLWRVERDVTVQVNLEIVGLVSFLFCVLLFYHLPVAPLLLM